MAKTVAALFDNPTAAYHAGQDLVDNGFARDDISVMTHDATSSDGPTTTEDSSSGLAQGAGLGAALGGVGGLVLGLTALAIPGVGPVIAAGPLAAALVGASVGAAAGGLIGALTDIGIPEEQAHYYGEGMRRGGVLVTVATMDEMAERAVSILSRHNPIDLTRRAEEWQKSGWNRFDHSAEPYLSTGATRGATATQEPWAARTAHVGIHTVPNTAPMPGASQTSRAAATAPSYGDKVARTATSPVVQEELPALRDFHAYDASFRKHFDITFAQRGAMYDAYMPAYRYGYTLATDKRYSNRDWTTFAAEAQRDWELEHPGTWEQFKDAIRHAWDEVRGRR